MFGLELVSGVWEEKVLFSLDESLSYPVGLARRPNGVLYGQNINSIFKAMPPQPQAAPGRCSLSTKG